MFDNALQIRTGTCTCSFLSYVFIYRLGALCANPSELKAEGH